MKLVAVLMLTALPLYCYAGSGCETLETVISMTANRNVSVSELINYVQDFIPGEDTEKAIIFLKEGFFHLSEETVEKFLELQEMIFSSFWCAQY
ncbi:mammaglobin-A-like [Phyllostomus hastatus]|uniref:mammaglobin-A-like n=1 Tax=Phyllostomus hastatus TaxID=9423 RepID=UPI001E67F010|nr:mammaglobin-A-like [Phyllostomus hastatus]